MTPEEEKAIQDIKDKAARSVGFRNFECAIAWFCYSRGGFYGRGGMKYFGLNKVIDETIKRYGDEREKDGYMQALKDVGETVSVDEFYERAKLKYKALLEKL